MAQAGEARKIRAVTGQEVSGPAIPAAKQLTPNKIQAGPALAVQIVDDTYIATHGLQAGKSIPVYQVTTGKVEAGPAVPVYLTEGGVTAPVADFSANITALQEPTSMTVNFTDLSTNSPTSWSWNFGDSTTSTSQNPTKVYTAPGTYTVSLIATNAAGNDTETKVAYITVTAWYRAGGAPAPAGAYRGKGAASYAASLVNLVNPGTNNLTEGNGAVTWSSAAGWQFTAAQSKYFLTGLTPGNGGWSLIVQYSGVTATGALQRFAGQQNTTGNRRFYVSTHINNNNVLYGQGGSVTAASSLAAGNLAVAGQQGYRNGVADGGAIAAWDAGGTIYPCFVGTANVNGAPSADFINGNIRAVAIYNQALTAPQVAAVAAAMANL